MKNIFKKKTIKNLYDILMTPSMRILPGTLAYYLVLSIVPIVTLIAAACSKFSISTGDMTTIFDTILPNGVEELLISVINSAKNSDLSVLLIILTIIFASNGAHSIILASNNLYNIKDKSYLERRIKALFLTIILIGLILFVIFVLGFGNIIIKFILSLKIFEKTATQVYSIFLILKWPVAVVTVFFLVKVIFTMAPDSRIPSKYVNKGAMFTTVGLILSTSIYSYYANNIADYSYIYGNLANIIILMVLFFVIAYFIVAGIAINANIYELEKSE